jgi:hypothetical protein
VGVVHQVLEVARGEAVVGAEVPAEGVVARAGDGRRRTVGAEELAPWRVAGECYVAAFVAGEVCDAG